MSRGLEGRVALVTGASRGIGEAAARALAAQGAEVVLASRNRGDLERVADGIRRCGGRARVVPADLAKPDAARALAAESGAVDVLLNNAGAFLGMSPALATDAEHWDYTFALNFHGPRLLMEALVPGMVERGRGSVIQVSTATGHPAPLVGPYVAAKSALEALTRVLAMEVAHAGVRCNCVVPGLILTEMAAQAGGDFADYYRSITPLGRLAKPEEFVPLIVWLACDESRFVTGEKITAGGGYTIGEFGVTPVLERMGLEPRYGWS
jgi:NAD(P)-dependent dehydrogenase (short-subunit alcohol dehydrogenase family)